MGHWESTGHSDEWYTPRHVFDALGVTFDLDVAAPRDTKTFVPAASFIFEASLEADWNGFVWMNPPFGGRNALSPWLDKFFDHGNGIALVPDRTSAPWFQEAWAKAELALFTRKLRFHRPDGSVGASPSNGTALLAAGEKAKNSLLRAATLGLGIIAHPIKPASAQREDADLLVASKRLREIFQSDGGGFSRVTDEVALDMARPHEKGRKTTAGNIGVCTGSVAPVLISRDAESMSTP